MCGACVLKLGAFVLCVYPSRAGGGPFLVDSDDETALKLANLEDYGDGTPLHYAALNGSETLCEYYISQCGSDEARSKLVNSTRAAGAAKRSPLMNAVSSHRGVVELLLRHGADFNERDAFGWSVLQRAARSECDAIVAMLIEKARSFFNDGAKFHGYIEHENKFHMTALMFAAEHGTLRSVQHLLAAGAQLTHKNNKKLTAMEYAHKSKNKELISFLEAKVDERSKAALVDTTYIIDSGSMHTTIFKYGFDAAAAASSASGGGAAWHETHNGQPKLMQGGHVRVVDPNGGAEGKGGNVKLGDDVLKTGSFDLYLDLVSDGLRKLGWQMGMKVFIGGTGGVRDLIKQGLVTEERVDEFRAALAARFGAQASFGVLSPDEEADYERRAAWYAFSDFIQKERHAPVALLSGGGSSVQVYFEGKLASRSMPVRKKEQLIKKDSVDERLAGAREIEAAFVKEVHEPEGLPKMSGSFVGLNAFEDISQLGFGEKWLDRETMLRKLEKLEFDLIHREGKGWKEANTKWRARLTQLWTIGAVGAMRLRVLLRECFNEDSTFYFANAPPGSKNIDVAWPLGKRLQMDGLGDA